MSAPDNASNLAAKLGYITEQDLILLAGVTAGTTESWRRRGRGPVSTRIGNTVLYPISGVVQFLQDSEKQRTTSVKEAI